MPPNLVGEDVDPRLALLSPEARLLALAAAVEGQGPLAPEEVAARLLGPLSAVAGTPWLTVTRLCGDRLTLVAAGGDIPPPLLDLARAGIPRGPGLAWRALETRRPVYAGRYGGEAGTHPPSAALFGGAVAHLPLLGPGGEPWGVLTLAGQKREEWPGGLQVALEAVATMVGRALELGRLAREEREAARLRESEGRLRRLFDSPMIGVLFWEADGRVTAANDAFLDTVGYSREDFEAGRVDWRELTPPEWVERDAQGMRELLGTGRMAHFEKEFVRRDGSRVPVLVGGTLLEGKRTQGVSFVLDITERRRAEEEVRRLNAELERRVVERTAELTNARVRAEFLAALADALETAASPEAVAAVALERLGPTLGASAMFVVRLEGESLRLPTVWGEPPPGVLAALTRPGVTITDMPMFSRARDTGRGVYLEDYMAQPARVAGWAMPPTAYAAQPVRRPDGRLEGFLVAWRGGPRPWLEGERDLLARAAATLGLALERAEATAGLEARRAELTARNAALEAATRRAELLAALSDALETRASPAAVVAAALERVGPAVGATYGVAYRLEPDRLRPLHAWGEVPDELQRPVAEGFPRGEGGVSWRVATTGAAHYSADYGADPDALGYVPRAGVAVKPLRASDGRVLGVWALVRPAELGEWDEEERGLLRGAAVAIGLALERAEATERLEAQRAELEARNRALEAFAALAGELALETDPVRLVGRAQEIALSMLPPAAAAYYVPENGLWRLRSRRGDFGDPALEAVIAAGLPVGGTDNLDRPWLTGQGHYQDSYAPAADGLHEETRHIGASAAVPVRAAGGPRGVLVFGLFGGAHAWSSAERAALDTVARSLGLALERAVAVAEREAAARALEERSRALAAFVAFTEAAGAGADLLDLAGRAHEVFLATLGECSASLWVLEDGVWKGRARWGHHDPATVRVLEEGIPEDTPAHREILASEGPVFFDGWTASEDYRDGAREFGAAAGQRVLVEGEPPAILGYGLRAARAWSEADKATVRAVERALLLAVERGHVAARLERQRAELEARNSESETFVYTVSHDLRAPLLAINGMSALLEEAVSSGDADEAAFLLGRVRKNVATMGQLLSDLLTLSRVGRLAEPEEPLDLAEVFAAVLAELEPRLRERGVEVTVPADCPTVRYPRSEAYQLLANLLGNAAKFAGRGGEAPRVALSCEAAGGVVTVRVSDNGPGVPAAYRERVFELFKQVNPQAEGTGVGLAIVKRIVERHGGKVWVEDSPPPPEGLGGATFAVTLPAG